MSNTYSVSDLHSNEDKVTCVASYFRNKAQDKIDAIFKSCNADWIPVKEQLPETDDYILLSFSNFSLPQIGRYEEDEEGGAFYIGDEAETCISQDLYVNAWMPLPEPYREESGGE